MIKRIGVAFVQYIIPLVLFTVAGGILAFIALRARPDILGVVSTSTTTSPLIMEVSQYVSVPSDEEPTIATVTDITKLPNAPIFKNAVVGDKVIAYAIAKKIILYRPSEKKVIDQGSFDTYEEVASPSASIIPQSVTQVVVLHEASKSAQLTSFENELGTEPSIKVIDRQYQFKQQPTETLVVDITGQNSDLLRKIAVDFRLVASLWPEGEIKPLDADLVVLWKSTP